MTLGSHSLRAGRRHLLPVLLFFFVAAAFLQRTVGTHDSVLRPGEVVFLGNDAWYHSRLITHAAVTGERLRHDPYLLMPDGAPVAVGPLFDDLGAVASRIQVGGRRIDASDPREILLTQRTAAWLPAMLGALLVIPVVLLSRGLWGPAAGWIAGIGYLAVPGQILNRSLLGAADHHVGEVLFSTCCFAALVWSQRPVSNQSTGMFVALCSIAGLALGAYQLTWIAGVLLPLVLIAWLGAVTLGSWGRLFATGGTGTSDSATVPRAAAAAAWTAASCLLVLSPQVDGVRVPAGGRNATVILLLLAVGLLALHPHVANAARASRRKRLGWLASFALIGGAVLLMMTTRLDGWTQLGHYASFLRPRPIANTVAEAAPWFRLGGQWVPLWRELGMGWLVALPGLGLIGTRALRRGAAADTLVLVWSLVAIVLTVGQNRFGYYLGVVSILAVSAFLGTVARSFESGRLQRRSRATILFALGILLLFVTPNLRRTRDRMRQAPAIPSGWIEATDWIRERTPAPFDTPDCFFVGSEERADSGTPECRPSFGVFTWWDYGYWLIQRAQRVPFANPTQAGAPAAARILLSDADEAVEELRAMDANLIVVDASMGYLQLRPGVRIGKFDAISTWADAQTRHYARRVQLEDDEGATLTTTVYFPRYFRSLVGRVASYGAAAVRPERIALLEFGGDPDLVDRDPIPVQSVRWFDEVETADRFLETIGPENRDRWRVASFDPLQTPVVLPPVAGLEQSFQSREAVAKRSDGEVPRVRVLEILPRASGEADFTHPREPNLDAEASTPAS